MYKMIHTSLQYFHRALVAHGEAVTWVSCHSGSPVWRYATLGVVSKICRKLLFNNLSKWAWPISRDSAQSSEHVDIRILNVQQSIWEL